MPPGDPPSSRDTPRDPHRLDDDPPLLEPTVEQVLTVTQRAIAAEVAQLGGKVDALITSERGLAQRTDSIQRTQDAHGRLLTALTNSVTRVEAAQTAASTREADRDGKVLLAIARLERGVSQHDISIEAHERALTWREHGQALVAAGAKHGSKALVPAIAAAVASAWPHLVAFYHQLFP